jgi:hypothetical protein
MLEIKRTAISLDENDLIELVRICIDGDKEGALGFLKQFYKRINYSQQGKLKSHLDTGVNPVDKFNKDINR